MKILMLSLMTSVIVHAAGLRAGVARVPITPKEPIWMSGYASRNHPSVGVVHEIWAKALAIEDDKGHWVVLVSTDLIGLSRSVSDAVAARIVQQYSVPRSGLVLNSSHTHTGPVVRANLATMYDLSLEQQRVVDEYTRDLTDKLVTVVGAAIGDLKPAVIAFGSGTATFGVNRREPTSTGVKIGVNPSGPTDHDVPVLRVTSPDGKVRAILFGYACHNTTLTGEFYQISGDYAGYAQTEVEKAFPGATALYYQLCAGDQNPNPRSKLELAEQHGKTLADEVGRIARGTMNPVSGTVKSAYQVTELPLAPYSRATFEKEATESNVFRARRARLVLKAFDERHEPHTVSYPIQAIRFKKGFTLLALGGEVVVDYQLWAKKAFPNEPLVVAGYSNDVMCYIPTARILREGGYEPIDSMIYYGMPGPFGEEVEPRLQEAATAVLRRVIK
jgi:neutral ceramidase